MQEVRVYSNTDQDPRGRSLLHEITHTLGLHTITNVRTVRVYRLQGIDASRAQVCASSILADAVSQTYTVNKPVEFGAIKKIEVGFKPGVMNPEVAHTVTADFKQIGSYIVFVGNDELNLKTQSTIFEAIHHNIQCNNILSCHDISEGGLAVAMAEMCFGGDVGVLVDLGQRDAQKFLFNETVGRFVIEVAQDTWNTSLFADVPHCVLGVTTQEKNIVVYQENKELFTAELAALKQAWQKPMQEVFNQ